MEVLQKVRNFLQGTIEEVRKIQWPSREVVINNAFLVIVAILVSVLIVAGIDYLLAKVINWYVNLR
ncbi:preprotein translocase subunit SecE [bacterium]|nr:preprotein translocase subunit SecE [bacterium]